MPRASAILVRRRKCHDASCHRLTAMCRMSLEFQDRVAPRVPSRPANAQKRQAAGAQASRVARAWIETQTVGSQLRAGSDGPTPRIVIEKTDPSPNRLSTMMAPMASAILLQTDRPRPVPPKRRVVDCSACENGSKMLPTFSGGIPMPVSATEKSEAAAFGFQPNRERCLRDREFDRVAEQIADDLAEAGRIAFDRTPAPRVRCSS